MKDLCDIIARLRLATQTAERLVFNPRHDEATVVILGAEIRLIEIAITRMVDRVSVELMQREANDSSRKRRIS